MRKMDTADGQAMAAQRRVCAGQCWHCGAAFTGTAKRRYCSVRCRVAAWEVRQAGTRVMVRKAMESDPHVQATLELWEWANEAS
jgi:hypothetical protein